MKTLLWICTVLLLVSPVMSAEESLSPGGYSARTIPRRLSTDAAAVVRHEVLTLSVLNVRDAVCHVHVIVTVLKAEGRVFGELALEYDTFRKISTLDGALYDADGEEIRSLGKADIQDFSAAEGLYDDHRIRTASLYHGTYPYTVEFEYELRYDGYTSWPAWSPERALASVESSTFTVELPEEMKLRYRGTINKAPSVTKSRGGVVTYQWHIGSLPPFESEPLGPPEQQKSLHIAPEKFEIDDHPGDLTSWDELGRWYSRLQEGRQVLPGMARLQVANATAGVSERGEKIRRLYKLLQEKTRYVSVQLGIGGWQPFDASYVFERGYGDCKALTNYMVAMLRAAKIEAYPALIYTGAIPIHLDPEFPENRFNHVVLFAPSAGDTIWLECTSQSIPFGHISRYNENRYALVVKPEGSTLVRTPSSRASDNLQVRTARVVLDPKGHGAAEITARYTGNQRDFVWTSLADASPLDREKWLRNAIDIPTFELQKAEYPDMSTNEQSMSLAFSLQLPRYASMLGSRLMFPPNLMEKRTYVPEELKERKSPIVHSFPYLDVDTVTYTLPAGYVIEALPRPVAMETAFARYAASVTPLEDGSLQYTRRLEVTATEIPAGMYNAYRGFFLSVVQADKSLAALVRK